MSIRWVAYSPETSKTTTERSMLRRITFLISVPVRLDFPEPVKPRMAE
jgi:hypothetical protein